MLIDTHTHLNFDTFQPNLLETLKAAAEAGISHLVVVGTNLENSKKGLEIAQKYPGVLAAVGIHPHHVYGLMMQNMESVATALTNPRWYEKIVTSLNQLEPLLGDPRVVAIGETGMDKFVYQKTIYPNYQITPEFIDLQTQFFTAQIQLAIKYKKSLIVHNRAAVKETLEILRNNWNSQLRSRVVLHFCEADSKLIDFAYEKRVFIGVTADITFDKAKQQFIQQVPLDLLVLETDSPFIPPKSHKEPNTPANVRVILKELAKIHKVDEVQIEVMTTSNAKQLFNIL